MDHQTLVMEIYIIQIHVNNCMKSIYIHITLVGVRYQTSILYVGHENINGYPYYDFERIR
jgi:hypothetical protein